MKYTLALFVFITILLVPGVVFAQAGSAAQELDNLRTQLADVQNREADLKTRLEQLDNDLKPENIERYFSGVGSTRPEELREQRRRQLQSEKDRVVVELQQTSAARTRLESSIVDAQNKVYQQSAFGEAALQREAGEKPVFLSAARLAIAISLAVLVGAAITLLFILRRRQRIE